VQFLYIFWCGDKTKPQPKDQYKAIIAQFNPTGCSYTNGKPCRSEDDHNTDEERNKVDSTALVALGQNEIVT
jgi:hypothetical protein